MFFQASASSHAPTALTACLWLIATGVRLRLASLSSQLSLRRDGSLTET